MPSLIETLVPVGAAFTALSTGLYFIVKLLINKSFEAGIERYKISLQQDLEAHKMSLQLSNHKFTKLHEAQCNGINEIFINLTNFKEKAIAIQRMARREDKLTPESVLDHISEVQQKEGDLGRSYEKNRILLSEQLSNKVAEVTDTIHEAVIPAMLILVDNSQVPQALKDELVVRLKRLGSYDAIETIRRNARTPEEATKLIDKSLDALASEFRGIYGA